MTDEPKSKMHLTDMEVQLAADEQGSYRDEVCQDLEKHALSVKQAIDGGLSSEDFQVAEKLMVALGAARAVVRDAWKSEHPPVQ